MILAQKLEDVYERRIELDNDDVEIEEEEEETVQEPQRRKFFSDVSDLSRDSYVSPIAKRNKELMVNDGIDAIRKKNLAKNANNELVYQFYTMADSDVWNG